MNTIKQFGIIPIDFATLATVFREYKSPKDKVASMEKNGDLIRLKKGLFVVSPKIHGQTISGELIANHLYGPSYISFESALSFHKLIPERVHTVRSMTIKRGRNFSTFLGHFEYTSTNKEYFKIGIRQEIINEKYAFLIATPEKAICDMIVTTSRLRLQSVNAVQAYLEENLRIDLSEIEEFDIDIARQCYDVGKKKTELRHLIRLFER